MKARFFSEEVERIFIESKNFRSFNKSLDKFLALYNAYFVYHPSHKGKLPKKLQKCSKLMIIIHTNNNGKKKTINITVSRQY